MSLADITLVVENIFHHDKITVDRNVIVNRRAWKRAFVREVIVA